MSDPARYLLVLDSFNPKDGSEDYKQLVSPESRLGLLRFGMCHDRRRTVLCSKMLEPSNFQCNLIVFYFLCHLFHECSSFKNPNFYKMSLK